MLWLRRRRKTFILVHPSLILASQQLPLSWFTVELWTSLANRRTVLPAAGASRRTASLAVPLRRPSQLMTVQLGLRKLAPQQLSQFFTLEFLQQGMRMRSLQEPLLLLTVQLRQRWALPSSLPRALLVWERLPNGRPHPCPSLRSVSQLLPRGLPLPHCASVRVLLRRLRIRAGRRRRCS